MTVMIQGDQVRNVVTGVGPITKSTGTITGNPTTALFTIAGGEVLITHLWAKVTTSLTTDSGTYALQMNPTTGDTATIVTATDLGTTDTVAGTVVGLTHGTTAAPAFLRGGTSELNAVGTTGQIEFVGAASANGVITFGVMYVPLTSGASLVAA